MAANSSSISRPLVVSVGNCRTTRWAPEDKRRFWSLIQRILSIGTVISLVRRRPRVSSTCLNLPQSSAQLWEAPIGALNLLRAENLVLSLRVLHTGKVLQGHLFIDWSPSPPRSEAPIRDGTKPQSLKTVGTIFAPQMFPSSPSSSNKDSSYL